MNIQLGIIKSYVILPPIAIIFNFMIVPLIFHFLAKVLNFNNKYSKP